MSTRAPQFYDFLHFKGCSYLNRKISFNLSVEVAIFLVFHNPFMMLFHILMSVSDHELMLDYFLLRSSVWSFVYRDIFQFVKIPQPIMTFLVLKSDHVMAWDCMVGTCAKHLFGMSKSIWKGYLVSYFFLKARICP